MLLDVYVRVKTVSVILGMKVWAENLVTLWLWLIIVSTSGCYRAEYRVTPI